MLVWFEHLPTRKQTVCFRPHSVGFAPISVKPRAYCRSKADVSWRQRLAAVLENPLQYAGLVSHEAVNADLESSPLLINGPDMDLNAASLRSPHSPRRCRARRRQRSAALSPRLVIVAIVDLEPQGIRPRLENVVGDANVLGRRLDLRESTPE